MPTDHYATRAEFDHFRQQFHSDPSTAFAPFRSIPLVVQRDYSGAAIPVGVYGDHDRYWTFNGGGGLLYPSREIEVKVLAGASNFSGRNLRFRSRLIINETTIDADGWGIVYDGEESYFGISFRVIAMGSNSNQIVSGFSSVMTPLTESLALPWEIGLDVTWADNDDLNGTPETFLTQPVPDTYFVRHHSLVVLT